ncbi:N-acetylglucosamine-6-phosphate deacetylase [Caloranaerobacter azorensis]|uniref:N-acetylglucosamine-6-phosphate deacetylase n=1 Tax=Caloranaerobacter azorensis TaxID=116090 RepID=A0A6P1YE11_9FIRM|nr:N-acetylglucosamine-6-phosphate deacetylase [Caloranaerobacter azorensis]QIB27599.1 N-acetylglucosamine-6-phosphate deacetylase [Caloranaerobacter azorensis]
MKILIKNAKIITPYEILKDYAVSIIDNKIEDLRKEDDFDEKNFDKIIDANGNYLSPGFIDIHNHGNFGYDTMNATFESLESMSYFHLKNGVTGFLPTTMTASLKEIKMAIKNVADYIELQNNKNKFKEQKSQVLGLYLEGPYFSQEKKGAHAPRFLKSPEINELKEFLDVSNQTVKIVALAPELPGALEAITYLKSNGIIVSAGHTNATFLEMKTGIDKGITLATHLYNGMRCFSHREPAVVGAVLTDERVFCEVICDGIHLHAAAIELAVKVKGKDKIVLISDAMMATGLEDGEYEIGGQKVYVKRGVARLSDGSLAGSTLTLNKAVYNMVNTVNIPLQDAVRMASLNPAKVIGISDKKGSIEIGKDADLIIFDENIRILTTIVMGNIVSYK